MDENLKKEIIEMNDTLMKCLNQFIKFRKRNIINPDICNNLHALIKNIDGYMESDLKCYDFKISETSTGDSNAGENSNSNQSTSNESKSIESKNSKCVQQTQKTVINSPSKVNGLQEVAVEEEEEEYKYDISKILELHGVVPVMKIIYICGICTKHLPHDRKLVKMHLMDHKILVQNCIESHIKVAINWMFFCNLCCQDIGYDDKISLHVVKNIHLKEFHSKHIEKIKDDLKKSSSVNVEKNISKKRNYATCKLCKKSAPANEYAFKNHLTSVHQIKFDDWRDQFSFDSIYFCELCKESFEKIESVANHVFLDMRHLRRLIEIYQNQSVPPKMTYFPYTEINDLYNSKFQKLVINELNELQHIPIMNDELLDRHYIFRVKCDIYGCRLCNIRVGTPQYIIRHLVKLDHLYNCYKHGFQRALPLPPKSAKATKLIPTNSNNQNLNKPSDSNSSQKVESKKINVELIKVTFIGESSENKKVENDDNKENQNSNQSESVKSKKQEVEEVIKQDNSKAENIKESESPELENCDDDEELYYEIVETKESFMKFLNEKISCSNKFRSTSQFAITAKLIETYLRKLFPNVKAFIYGPHLYGLGCYHDEVMIFFDTASRYLSLPPNNKDLESLKKKVENIAKYLQDETAKTEKCLQDNLWSKFVVNYDPLSIKTAHKDHMCSYVFTFTNGMDHFKTNLIIYLFELQPICQKLCTFFLQIIEDCCLGVCFDTYSVVLMVIFYLQVNNYLPSIRFLQTQEHEQDDCVTKIGPWDADFKHLSREKLNLKLLNDDDLFDTIKDFLLFYSMEMDYNNEIICPYLGQQVQKSYLDTPSKEFENLKEFYKMNDGCDNVEEEENKKLNTKCAICLQDPIELNRNLTHKVNNFALNEFITSLEEVYDCIKW